jgi:polyphosphate kinase
MGLPTMSQKDPATSGSAPVLPETSPEIDLDQPALFINRELSWLEFNRRVLEEALDSRHPLLERVKFLAIFCSNLDEFFMIRVSGLRRQLVAGALSAPPDGMTPGEQLAEIRQLLRPMLRQAARCWSGDLLPNLRQAGIKVLSFAELKGKQRKLLRSYFKQEILPALTPLAFDPGHPFPHISNLSINLAVVVAHPDHGDRFARIKVPPVFPRLVRITKDSSAESPTRLGLAEASENAFVWL